MVEVFPELASLDQFSKVLVCGRKNTHINCDWLVSSHAPDGMVFDCSQHFGLDIGAQAWQLVEKQCPAVGRFKQTYAPCPRISECAPFVAK